MKHPPMNTMGRMLGSSVRAQAISRLLELGVLSTDLKALELSHLVPGTDPGLDSLIGYQMTRLGEAVHQYCVSKLGIERPELRDALVAYVTDAERRAKAARDAAQAAMQKIAGTGGQQAAR